MTGERVILVILLLRIISMTDIIHTDYTIHYTLYAIHYDIDR